MGNFTIDLRAMVTKAQANAERVARESLFEISRRLDMRSPVGDASYWKTPPPPGYVGGRFRANWQHGFSTPPEGTIDAVDPTGGATQARVMASVKSSPAAGVHYLVNNVPYAQRLEDGWSRQAPSGVVALTVIDFEGIVREQAAKT
jgi:hypothetical protein